MIERLHRAWTQQLRQEWQTLNRERLGGRLQPPVFIVDRGAEARLGRWDAQGRLLGIAERHIWSHPWHEVVETLKHEIAHQYVHEILEVHDETAHGAAFVQACRLLGADSRATARVDATSQAETDRILARVRKLLALAASPNVHEAELAMTKANTLLLQYNLELSGHTEPSRYGWRRVGGLAAALPVEWKLVASILSRWFFVECIWASVYNARSLRMERQLELVGSDTNLELASYVHDFLHQAGEQLWLKTAREQGWQGRQRRREFVAGVLMGFSQKLEQERRGHAERGLVWVGDPGVQAYFRERYPATRSLSGGGVRRGSAHEAGLEQGRNLKLHQGMETKGNRGLQLGRS